MRGDGYTTDLRSLLLGFMRFGQIFEKQPVRKTNFKDRGLRLAVKKEKLR